LMKAMMIHGAIYPPSGTTVQRKVLVSNGAIDGTTCPTSTARYDAVTNVGFGFVRLSNTILFSGSDKRIYLPGRDGSYVDNSNATLNTTFNDPLFTSAGQAHIYEFCAKAKTSTVEVNPKITLVWTDRVDTTQSGGALANNLDLNVTYGGTMYYGNGGTSFDSTNNVEQVLLTLPSSVNTDLVVTIKASSLFSSVQPYALVVTGYLFNGSCASNPDPTTVAQTTSVLEYLFIGLKVLWWIVIASGVCCCGMCFCWCYCAAFTFKAVFMRDGTTLKVIERKMQAVGTVTGPDGKDVKIKETVVVEEIDLAASPKGKGEGDSQYETMPEK